MNLKIFFSRLIFDCVFSILLFKNEKHSETFNVKKRTLKFCEISNKCDIILRKPRFWLVCSLFSFVLLSNTGYDFEGKNRKSFSALRAELYRKIQYSTQYSTQYTVPYTVITVHRTYSTQYSTQYIIAGLPITGEIT